MYKVIRGKRDQTGEVPGKDIVTVLDQSTGNNVFEADADSWFVLNGKTLPLGDVPDQELIEELVRKGRLN